MMPSCPPPPPSAPVSLHSRATALLGLALAATACANLGNQSGGPATYDVASYSDGAADTTADSGAAEDVGAQADAPADTAVPPADTAAAKTCKDRCNTTYKPGDACQCNADCAKFGNCCPDYGALCQPEQMTCEGRCAAGFDANKPCQCTWDCAKYGTCCPNFVSTCHGSEDLDFFAAPKGACSKASDWKVVQHVSDGDTLVLADKDSAGNNLIVRFLLVDTPELSTEDCYAIEAKKFTWGQIQKSPSVCLVKEPSAGDKDTYGRLLRYVFYKEPIVDGAAVELNLRLLRLGYARVLYPFAKGNPYEAKALLTMAKAKEDKLGGWAKCGWIKPK